MERLKQWMGTYKQLCVLLGIFGLLLSPFLWPFFLAIIFQSLTLAVPVLLVFFLKEHLWKEKRNDEKEQLSQGDAGNNEKGEGSDDSSEFSNPVVSEEENPISSGQEKRTHAVKKESAKKEKVIDEESSIAISWYQMEGRMGIQRLMQKVKREKLKAFSIDSQGICTVRDEKRFRRIGVLRGFPGHRIQIVEQELKRDGFRTNIAKGKYLWISWGGK